MFIFLFSERAENESSVIMKRERLLYYYKSASIGLFKDTHCLFTCIVGVSRDTLELH